MGLLNAADLDGDGYSNAAPLDGDAYSDATTLPDKARCKKTEFVRNGASKFAREKFSLSQAFSCAWSGFVYILRSQRNMKIHLTAAALAIMLGFILKIDAASWTAIFLCIGCVLTAECFNTALESLVDLVSPQYHKLARYTKDCAAAGVLVFAVISVVVALIIFVPRVVALAGIVF